MKKIVEALQNLYVRLGGESNDASSVSEAIDNIADVMAGGGSGGSDSGGGTGSGARVYVKVSMPTPYSHVCEKTAQELFELIDSGADVRLINGESRSDGATEYWLDRAYKSAPDKYMLFFICMTGGSDSSSKLRFCSLKMVDVDGSNKELYSYITELQS